MSPHEVNVAARFVDGSSFGAARRSTLKAKRPGAFPSPAAVN